MTKRRVKRIMVKMPDGGRRPVRLAGCTVEEFKTFKRRVRALVRARDLGEVPDVETMRWLERLGERYHGRLVELGLVRRRQNQELGPWLDKLIGDRTDLKDKSRKLYQLTRAKLVEFFGAHKLLRDITRDEASSWRSQLGGSEASVRTHVGNAKGFFREAVSRGLIHASPLEHLKGGSTASTNDRYVTMAESAAILAAMKAPWAKLAFALARYAGLRIESEGPGLTWGDVDWDKRILHVHDKKRERFQNHSERRVPITGELLMILREAYGEGRQCGEPLFNVSLGGENKSRRLQDAIKAAGVSAWEDLWRTLRSSCEKWWAGELNWPQYAVSKAMGHSLTVSGKHYANSVPDELWAKLLSAQKATQQDTESPRNASHGANQDVCEANRKVRGRKKMPHSATPCGISANIGVTRHSPL